MTINEVFLCVRDENLTLEEFRQWVLERQEIASEAAIQAVKYQLSTISADWFK